MIISIIFFGLLYQYLYFVKINEVPENGESYRLKTADFKYSFKNDGSCDVEQELVFQPNKNTASKNSLSYIFYETGDINSLEVKINNNLAENSGINAPNTYELKTAANKNVLNIYFPYNKVENLDLSIKYKLKNAFLYDDIKLVYYNTFLPERTDFSYNTNVKGKIEFYYPENSSLEYASNSKNFYVDIASEKGNSILVNFENKLPYEKSPLSRFADWIRLYDPASFKKTYIKDFSLVTRLDFSATFFKKELLSSASKMGSDLYGISELQSLNKENNEKFSDIKFIVGVFFTHWFHGTFLFLFVAFPIIFSYYKKAEL